MNSNANIQLVTKYFDSLSKGDLKTLGSLFAEDVVWHQPGNGSLSKTYHGKQELFPLFGKIYGNQRWNFQDRRRSKCDG